MIFYVKGDATKPNAAGNKIIAHSCNNKGGWGKGFVLAISNRWMDPEFQYRSKTEYVLGTIDTIQVENDIWVTNMIAQDGTLSTNPEKKQHVDYESLRKCISLLNQELSRLHATLHIPRIGAGLGGGKWEEIEKIILEEITRFDIFVYDLK